MDEETQPNDPDKILYHHDGEFWWALASKQDGHPWKLLKRTQQPKPIAETLDLFFKGTTYLSEFDHPTRSSRLEPISKEEALMILYQAE